MGDFPFTEKKMRDNLFLREFKENVESQDLVWHQDRENRTIVVLESDGWKLQMDNELPFPLVEGEVYDIPAYSFHRVIKGTGDLRVVVEKRQPKEDKDASQALSESESGNVEEQTEPYQKMAKKRFEKMMRITIKGKNKYKDTGMKNIVPKAGKSGPPGA